MPVYEYECERCSLRFELKKRFGENSEAECPKCQGKARRIFSPVPIIFKGSGFYVTDKAAEKGKRAGNKRDGDRPADADKSAELPKENKESLSNGSSSSSS